MKKTLLILILGLFCFTQTAYAKGTETTEKVGSWIAISAPAWIGFLTTTTEWLGAPEIAASVAIGVGAYKTYIGDWGKDGTEALKNCVGTHVNGNCSHLELSLLGTGGNNVYNFAGIEVVTLNDIGINSN
jgi:hypothetical protein